MSALAVSPFFLFLPLSGFRKPVQSNQAVAGVAFYHSILPPAVTTTITTTTTTIITSSSLSEKQLHFYLVFLEPAVASLHEIYFSFPLLLRIDNIENKWPTPKDLGQPMGNLLLFRFVENTLSNLGCAFRSPQVYIYRYLFYILYANRQMENRKDCTLQHRFFQYPFYNNL